MSTAHRQLSLLYFLSFIFRLNTDCQSIYSVYKHPYQQKKVKLVKSRQINICSQLSHWLIPSQNIFVLLTFFICIGKFEGVYLANGRTIFPYIWGNNSLTHHLKSSPLPTTLKKNEINKKNAEYIHIYTFFNL